MGGLPNVGTFYTVKGQPAAGFATKYYRNAVDNSITVVSVSAIVQEDPTTLGIGGGPTGGGMASGDLTYVDPSAHSSLFGGFSQADADLMFSFNTPCGCGGDAAPGGSASSPGGPGGLAAESLPAGASGGGPSASTQYVTPDWMFGKSAAGIPFWMILAAFAALAYLVFKD